MSNSVENKHKKVKDLQIPNEFYDEYLNGLAESEGMNNLIPALNISDKIKVGDVYTDRDGDKHTILEIESDDPNDVWTKVEILSTSGLTTRMWLTAPEIEGLLIQDTARQYKAEEENNQQNQGDTYIEPTPWHSVATNIDNNIEGKYDIDKVWAEIKKSCGG